MSATFIGCLHDHKHDAAFHELYDASFIPGHFARLRLQTMCAVDWTEKYQGPISAVGTLLVAVFTFTLWRTTRRLWTSAERQLAEFRTSLAIAEKHAEHMAALVRAKEQTAERPLRAYIGADRPGGEMDIHERGNDSN